MTNELEIRIKTAIPSEHGLYPHELLMLSYAHTYTTGINKFQQFWEYNYFIDNPQQILDSLYQRKFIQQGSFKNSLSKLKLPQIKSELKSCGEKVSGKKEDLVKRLLECGNISELEKKYPIKYYELTKLGELELKENEYISYISNHSIENLTIWDMNIMLGNDNKASYRDKIWKYLNEASGQHFKNKDYGLYRNTRLTMYNFLMEEEKYNMAFNLISEVAYYDLSGLLNGDLIEDKASKKYELEQRIEMAFPYENSCFNLPPGIREYLEDMKERLSDGTFKEKLYERFNKLYTPFHLFTKEECVNIVIAEINQDTDTLKEIYKQSEKRLKSKIQNI